MFQIYILFLNKSSSPKLSNKEVLVSSYGQFSLLSLSKIYSPVLSGDIFLWLGFKQCAYSSNLKSTIGKNPYKSDS